MKECFEQTHTYWLLPLVLQNCFVYTSTTNTNPAKTEVTLPNLCEFGFVEDI